MAEFSISDAALSGFRFITAHPKTILSWAAGYVVMAIVFIAVLAAIAAGPITGLVRSGVDLENNPAALLAAGPALVAAGIVAVALVLIIIAVVYGAAYRAFLRPAEGGFGYFRLGAVEWRLLGAYLLFQLASFVFSFVPPFIGGFAGAAAGEDSPVGILTGIAYIAAITFVFVRLSLLFPMTFDRNRVSLMDAWRMTRGRFWRIFAVYLLMAVIFALALIGLMLVLTVVGMALRNVTGPIFLLLAVLLYPVLGACGAAVMFAPAAAIYRALSPGDAVAETFV